MKQKKTFLGTLWHKEVSSLFFESHQYEVVKSGTTIAICNPGGRFWNCQSLWGEHSMVPKDEANITEGRAKRWREPRLCDSIEPLDQASPEA